MDDYDPINRDSGQRFSFEPMDEPSAQGVRTRSRSDGLVVLLIVLILAAGIIACCMVFDLQFRFDRMEGGFSLQLQNPQEQTPSQPSRGSADTLDRIEAPTVNYNPTAQPAIDLPEHSGPLTSETEPPLTIGSEHSPLTLQQIYAKLIPSYASITAFYGAGASSGSGIILTEDGYIATNAHVVSGAFSVRVTLQDGFELEAQLIGADYVSDLAVLKVDITGLTPAEFGDSDALLVGDTVVAIGDPLGSELRGTMTDGIVSAINRDLQIDGRTMTLIQTNAALNEGNSGGPLINLNGQVIGINTMKMSSSYASIEGLGFAIPSSVAMPILNELMTQGYISGRPALGFSGITVPAYASAFYRLPPGVYIQQVDPASDAGAKGLSPGDVVTGWNDTEIYNLDDLNEAKNACAAGDAVLLTVYRSGSFYEVEIILGEAIG